MLEPTAEQGTPDRTDPLAATGRGESGDTGDTGALTRGEIVGRYVVLSYLGHGGMSVVYAAYDPELDRKVALKLLKAQHDGPRLQREAQALAQLSHPNVVPIYDVGVHERRVWLAMEFIAGRTLTDWLGAQRRQWHEILSVFIGAGRGLYHAHLAGLIHRDFKPDNVMLTVGGDPKVTDFGLAHAERPVRSDLPTVLAELRGTQALATPLTQAGALLGTPRYMAPEQWKGEVTDARTDQFSFCVSLWSALYGEMPFPGTTIPALALAVTLGSITGVRKHRDVPSWLCDVLLRGLQVERSARYPAMKDLLLALELGHSRALRRRIQVGVLAAAVVAAASVGLYSYRHAQHVTACERTGDEAFALWNPEQRSALQSALVAGNPRVGDSVYAKIAPRIDQWAQLWSTARTRACLAAEVEGSWSGDLYVRATTCLEERRAEMQGLLAAFSGAPAERALDAIRAFHVIQNQPGLCTDTGFLADRPAPPEDPDEYAEVKRLRGELMHIKGLVIAGDAAVTPSLALDLLSAAEKTGYGPLQIEARSLLGRLQFDALEYEQAEANLIRAYADAGAISADELAAAAAVSLVWAVGNVCMFQACKPDDAPARLHEAVLWSHSARMFLRRIGPAGKPYEVSLLQTMGLIYAQSGAHDQAQASYERALEIVAEAFEGDHPHTANILTDLALLYMHRGELTLARGTGERALEIQERMLGAEHPDVAMASTNLALVQSMLGDHEAALRLHRRALTVQENALGPEDHRIVMTLMNLANECSVTGRYAESRMLYGRALALQETDPGAAPGDVAGLLSSFAAVQQRSGMFAEARVLLDRALAILEQTSGANHPDVAIALMGIANGHFAAGRPQDAVGVLERAASIVDDHEDRQSRFDVYFALARALIATEGGRDRAMAAANTALDEYHQGGLRSSEIEMWLAEQEEAP